MSDLKDIQQQLRSLRSDRDGTEVNLRRNQQQAQKLDKQIEQLQRQGDNPNAQGMLDQLRQERKRIDADIVENRKAWLDVRADGQLLANRLLVEQPWQLVEQLPDHIPFLLLPVKVETKFAKNAAGGNELWVRFFPDTVAVSSHEEELMAAEVEAGQLYWTSIWETTRQPTSPDDLQNARRGAWNALASRFNPHRSLWIARATRPLNWKDELLDEIEELVFPVQETKAAGWTLAPRSKVMPDRFVVTTLQKQGDNFVQALPPAVGALVPDTLILGPDPAQLEGEFRRDPVTGELKLDPGMAWLSDFDKAVEVGMAVRIPLPNPWHRTGFDRLVVLGLRLSADDSESQQLVEDLLNGHRYTSGISFLPQGTATNNSEDVPSGFNSFDPSNEKSFQALDNPGNIDHWNVTHEHHLKQDGQRFAEALGLDYPAVAPIENAATSDVSEAIAMNTALYPATLGDFLKDMVGPAFDDATRNLLQGFFQTNVSGRGHLPAFRVGSQPYGVLVTSALDRWQWSKGEHLRQEQFYDGLLLHIRNLSTFWRQAVASVKHAGDGKEPFQRLLEILSLEATSTEYFSRKAGADEYVWNYYNYQGLAYLFFRPTWEQMKKKKQEMLTAVGLGGFNDLQINELSFFKDRERLYGPVVDGDPDLPLSEAEGIRPYFKNEALGLRFNYVHWLLNSSKQTIEREQFVNEQDKGVSPPRALLYMLLRQAFLNELATTGKRWLLAEKLVTAVPNNPRLLNMNGEKHVSNRDLLNVTVPQSGGVAIGDEILFKLRFPVGDDFHPSFAPMLNHREAVKRLADLPTARLERLFAEHVDLCSYRLDAWITGLFQKRLNAQRFQRRENLVEGLPNYNRGTYLGAYGWVENLRPRTAPPRPVSPATFPTEFQSPEKPPVVEDPANGGYILAPSMSHAVTAAVLRNAYLSHANRTNNSPFSVNLSSRRVRTALGLLEGMRNGQNLAALLGYQLERGLHDNPGGLELDEYIYALRDKFPFISGKISEKPDGTPAEAVEANNVVNGYDLLHFVRGKTYPYGLPVQPANANGLPAPGTPKATAVVKEIDRLAASLDAIGDLALTESVYQVVQGNYERAGGMVQAISEGKTPPEPDFVNTPRNGKNITQRVAMIFRPSATSIAAGWANATVRSTANAPVNDWLGGMLPPPVSVAFEIEKVAGLKEERTLAQIFDLQPIDLVLMAGNHLGDQSSELERYLVHRIKILENLADGDELKIDFKKAGAGKTPLHHVQPLLRSLRRVITESRPLHALDLMTGIEGQKAPADNPRGHFADLEAFRQRVLAIANRLEAETNEAGAGLANFYAAQIKALYQAYWDDPDHVIEAAWEARLDAIRQRLLALVPLALPEALPGSVSGFDKIPLESLVGQVQAVLKILQKRRKEVEDGKLLEAVVFDPNWKPTERANAIDNAIANYGQAAKILLNQSFVALPFFNNHNVIELQACLAQNIEPDELAVETWLQGIGKVREKMGNLTTLATTHDLLTDGSFALSPIQLPFDAAGRWIGKEFGEDYALRNDTTSIMLHSAEPFQPAANCCGLVLDDWTEVVPEREVNAGISFHFNRPNAMPPQALLLAVPSQIKGHWTWDDLMAILNDTLDRSKMRAVDPNQLLAGPTFQTLPTVMTEFTNFNFRTIWAHNVIVRAGIDPEFVGTA